ncbi:unnamed protein product [Wuchereria bancrofti]|uniref:Uncharacterized protein n=1 Tax=Wuchereria bancrofti TaxID=6293 RepID=A0A3P7EKU4_WUCBA|nr:unnamed protein product [Wuchereria bancrofti]
MDHGVLVTLHKGMKPILLKNRISNLIEILLSYSNLDVRNVAHARVLGFKVGQKIIIQYLGRDPYTGYHRISRKTLQSASLPVQNVHHDT